MGIFDLFGKRPSRSGQLTLDAGRMEQWPERLLRQQGLHQTMERYVEEVEQRRDAVEKAREQLSNPDLLRKVPERAQVIYDEHVPLIRGAVQDLLDRAIVLNDVFMVDEQHQEFQDLLTAYKERTRKSNAALKEYLGEELGMLNQAIQGFEDSMLAIYPRLETAQFTSIKQVKQLVTHYKESKEREEKLTRLKTLLLKEIDHHEEKRRRHKEKIAFFTERSRDSKYKELIAEEEELLEQSDEIKVKGMPEEDETKALEPITQRLAWIRKQMINDITAMNINEQRTFLEAAKDEIRLRKRKVERIDDLLNELSFDTLKPKLISALKPFKARIEDANMIIEAGEDDVAPQ